jgi:hemerythrin-like domain-containing protein
MEGYAMSETSPLIEGLFSIHRIITRGLNNSIRKCDEYILRQNIPADEITGFSMYVTTLKQITHSHHLSEDEIAFPFMKNYIDAPYRILMDDHIRIAHDIDNLDQILVRLSSDNIARLRTALGEFEKLWTPHIKTEEENFTAEKLNKVGTEKQLNLVKELSAHGMKNAGRGSLALPFMFYNLEGNDRESFMKPFPMVVKKLLVPIIWKNQWRPMIPFLMYSSS